MSLYHNGRFLIQERQGADVSSRFVDCMIVKDGLISYLGAHDTAPKKDAELSIDIQQKIVLPGFVDGHMHLLLLGQSLNKVDLSQCKNLEEIRATIKAYAVAHPEAPRIMAKSWLESNTVENPNKTMLDDLDPRPIFIDSNGLHSTWCNTAALTELGVQTMPDPPGGTIHRDSNGDPNGILSETAAINLVWPYLSSVASMEAKLEAIRATVKLYHANGYTGLIEMAMDENAWEALQVLRAQEPLPIRLAAYWLILPKLSPEETLAQVHRAIALNAQHNAQTSPDCRIAGIKVICDGTVDTCTAALSATYASLSAPVQPMWTPDTLTPIIRAAVAANLQCALHAIGDAAVTMAIDVLEAHGETHRRHRIEHLELTSPADAARLGACGITASIQPVHADPAILRAWPRLIGAERTARAFAYAEFEAGGAVLAIGTDAPTAPMAPLKNLYVATTRRSARDRDDATVVNEHFALSLGSAVAGATRGSAYSVFAERETGTLAVGKRADFVVVDMQWEKERLLAARVDETWFGGERVWSREGDGE